MAITDQADVDNFTQVGRLPADHERPSATRLHVERSPFEAKSNIQTIIAPIWCRQKENTPTKSTKTLEEQNMQDSTMVTFQGKELTVKEMTVRQVREVFERLKNEEQQLFIDELLDQPVPAMLITESTGVPLEQLESAKPSELLPLCEAVIKVNPSFASMIKRRIEAADRLEKALLSANNLTAPSAP